MAPIYIIYTKCIDECWHRLFENDTIDPLLSLAKQKTSVLQMRNSRFHFQIRLQRLSSLKMYIHPPPMMMERRAVVTCVYTYIYIYKYLFIYTSKSGVVDVFTLDKLKLSLIKRLKTGGSDGGLGDKCKQSKRDTRVCHEENTINDAAAADSREYCIIYIFLNLFLHPSRRKKQNKKTL